MRVELRDVWLLLLQAQVTLRCWQRCVHKNVPKTRALPFAFRISGRDGGFAMDGDGEKEEVAFPVGRGAKHCRLHCTLRNCVHQQLNSSRSIVAVWVALAPHFRLHSRAARGSVFVVVVDVCIRVLCMFNVQRLHVTRMEKIHSLRSYFHAVCLIYIVHCLCMQAHAARSSRSSRECMFCVCCVRVLVSVDARARALSSSSSRVACRCCAASAAAAAAAAPLGLA